MIGQKEILNQIDNKLKELKNAQDLLGDEPDIELEKAIKKAQKNLKNYATIEYKKTLST